jgi:hypothetical protein
MGQYYVVVILGPDGEKREFIRTWVSSHVYGCGSKLMEHSYLNNTFTSTVEFLLSPEGPFWKSRVVWAGDYADEEPVLHETKETGTGTEAETEAVNLFTMAYNEEHKLYSSSHPFTEKYPFIVNHSKRQAIHKGTIDPCKREFVIHPLSLLTAEGNGRGGGDYHGTNEVLVGSWARDVISLEATVPAGYELITIEFQE